MEPQITHTRGHHSDQKPLDQPGGVVQGEEEHHEKKSMFSRAKDKAKKVKNTIANRAHGNHAHDDVKDDEDDQDHEEIVQDPEVQGAPSPGTFPTKVTDTDSSVPAPSVAPWDSSFDHEAKSGRGGTLGEKLKDSNVSKGTLGDKFEVDTDVAKHQERDVSPTSHQAKMSDPVSVGEHDAEVSPTDAEITPIFHSLNNMAIHDEPEHKKESVTTGSHDQLSLSPITKLSATTDQNHPQDMRMDETYTHQEGTTPIADKAISVKNDVTSKIGRGGNDDAVTSENFGGASLSGLESPKQKQSIYADMLSSATTAVASKFGYGGTDNALVQESEMTKVEGENVQSSDGEATVSGLEPPKPQTAYLGMLYNATNATKNAVASQFGYGDPGDAPVEGSEMSKGDA